MRMPDRDGITSKVKVQSPLVAGSVDSNDSDPIDISRASGSVTSLAGSNSSLASSAHYYPHRSAPFRSFSGASCASSHNRRHSVSRSIGSFVGSYEESILNGRMSQTPSRPLEFTASLGVLGRGVCKSSLRCPPHLTIQFPAYFYSETSPYVGMIDVEQHDDDKSAGRRGYRIPAQGQLQIIIKNPNKTAVKLFLIPYDVSDMPPSSKTFFRQKHYDAGDGDKLRYAIHVQICCPAEGKYYIHKSQRVVFANRVPDGKENLRIVVQSPTPAYTPWVPEKRQKRAEQHLRPDSKEPRFIGGSLLEVDQVNSEEGEALLFDVRPIVPSGPATPKSQAQHPRSPLFKAERFERSTSPSSALSRVLGGEQPPQSTDLGSSLHKDVGHGAGCGSLAEGLKALAFAQDSGKQTRRE